MEIRSIELLLSLYISFINYKYNINSIRDNTGVDEDLVKFFLSRDLILELDEDGGSLELLELVLESVEDIGEQLDEEEVVDVGRGVQVQLVACQVPLEVLQALQGRLQDFGTHLHEVVSVCIEIVLLYDESLLD
jgi:hypothetical protein